jgi:hypothetical protein
VTCTEIKNFQPIGVITEMETSKRRVTASEKTAKPTVLTVGHSTHPWKVFLALLRAHRVERVIDVRSIPRSRHNPQFNQETLRTKLRAARIGYVHCESSEACVMLDPVLRTWAGAIPRFVDSLITCRPRNSMRGYKG